MSMSDFDFEEVKQGSPRVQIPLIAILCLILLAIFAALVLFPLWGEISDEKEKEVRLRAEFEEKVAEAKNIDVLAKQITEVEAVLASMLEQLPSKRQMDTVLSELSKADEGRGVQFELFKPGPEQLEEETASIPISIQLKGTYNNLGAFIDAISKLPRVIAVSNITIAPIDKQANQSSFLRMNATATIYRTLDAEEKESRKRQAEAATETKKKSR